ncbi:ABC transporter ATP-binding protein [Candidatus Woesearchaeota archaeon]|nr:ABC transporter ATP-binding protein [Candidatus Woesearchaeota archaeon]
MQATTSPSEGGGLLHRLIPRNSSARASAPTTQNQVAPPQNTANPSPHDASAAHAPLISFQNVYKKIEKQLILRDITLSIFPGEIFGLIGASGAGKTTLLRCLIGFYKINSGMILYQDKDISKNPRLIRTIFGFGSQDNCFYEKLTLYENLHYFGQLYGVPEKIIKERAENLLGLVELTDFRNAQAKNLSGGMRRRLDLACSLMHSPKILILDEPTAGLDPGLRKHMWELITKINATGTTIIVSSHLLGEIGHFCTRIGIINHGELLKIGPPDQLKDLYSKDEEIHLETFPGKYPQIAAEIRRERLPVNYITVHDHKLIVYTSQAEFVLHKILLILEAMRERLLDVHVDKPSLNEVFEALTEKQKIRGSSEDQLVDYIKKILGRGYTKEQARQTLLQQGWPEDVVNAVMIKMT